MKDGLLTVAEFRSVKVIASLLRNGLNPIRGNEPKNAKNERRSTDDFIQTVYGLRQTRQCVASGEQEHVVRSFRFGRLSGWEKILRRLPVDNEGFVTPDGRHVFSIIYEIESQGPEVRELVVPLSADGTASNGLAQPVEEGKRIVDVKPGEQIRIKKELLTVKSVRAYRWAGMK